MPQLGPPLSDSSRPWAPPRLQGNAIQTRQVSGPLQKDRPFAELSPRLTASKFLPSTPRPDFQFVAIFHFISLPLTFSPRGITGALISLCRNEHFLRITAVPPSLLPPP